MICNLFPARQILFKSSNNHNHQIKSIFFRKTHNTKKLQHQIKNVKKSDFVEQQQQDHLSCYKIIQNNHEKLRLLDQEILSKTNVQLNDVEFQLINGNKLIFNLTWLRDSCHCELCTHKPSRQRHFTPKKFDCNLFQIQDARVIPSELSKMKGKYHGPSAPANSSNETGFLAIDWSDGHQSLYSLDWLTYFSSIQDIQSEQIKPLEDSIKFNTIEDDFYGLLKHNKVDPIYWSSALISNSLEPVEYESLIDGYKSSKEATFINSNRIDEMNPIRFKAMWSLTNQLMKFGLAKIVNVPREKNQVLMVANSLAYARPTGYGTVFNVVIEESEEKNLAYSSGEFDLHVDLAYREKSPGVQLLHCIKNSQKGGLSYFADAFKAATLLREQDKLLFDVLVQYPTIISVRDPYRDVRLRRQKTILTLDIDGKLHEIYYSPWALPPIGNRNDIKMFYLALDRFTSILHSSECKFVTKMDHGDLFIFNNRRVLHGRSAYDNSPGSRFLQGCYMDWDEICGLHEKLNNNYNKII